MVAHVISSKFCMSDETVKFMFLGYPYGRPVEFGQLFMHTFALINLEFFYYSRWIEWSRRININGALRRYKKEVIKLYSTFYKYRRGILLQDIYYNHWSKARAAMHIDIASSILINLKASFTLLLNIMKTSYNYWNFIEDAI